MANVNDLIHGVRGCGCGRDHTCPIDAVRIGEGALEQLPELCAPYSHIVLVADGNTWNACGKRVAELLGDRLEAKCILRGADVVIPDETAIETVQSFATDKTDLYVGVGSGVINDLCKYVSFARDLPYFIVGTAPSMDGYASVGCAMILRGMKVTVNARPPKAIIAEQSVLRNAPMDMLQSGYGDVIGKFSCLNDWRLSALLTGEYFCQTVYDLTYHTAVRVRDLGKAIAERDGKAVSALMDALVTVGIAMSYVDCSRPASGSEHHLSHFFELTGILEKKPYFRHGIDVAYSSVVTAKLRQMILAGTPEKRPFDQRAYERAMHSVYGGSAPGIIDLQYRAGAYTRRTPAVERFDEVKAILADSPTAEEFEEMIGTVGLDMAQFETMYGREKIETAVLYAKDLKDRYTVLNLYYDYFRSL